MKNKLIIVFILLIIMLFTQMVPSYALSKVMKDGDDFISSASSDAAIDDKAMKKTTNWIYNVLLIIGIAAAILVGAILGITFIVTGAEGKADVEKALVPYVIGCIVVFGAFGIWKIVVDVFQSM